MSERVSYIITTFNRWRQLNRSLARIARLQDFPDEMIVIDDGSLNESGGTTKDTVDSWRPEFPCGIKYFYHKKPDKTYEHHGGYECAVIAKNIGLKQATGDIVVFGEPEMLFVTPCISALEKYCIDNPKHMTNVANVAKMNWQMEIMVAKDQDDLIQNPEAFIERYGIHDYNSPSGGPDKDCFCRLINWNAPFVFGVRREHLMAIGGWDEDMAWINGGGGYAFDDIDMCTRLRISGINGLNTVDVVAIHQWHVTVPMPFANGWARNNEIFEGKGNPDGQGWASNVIANKNREWGVL